MSVLPTLWFGNASSTPTELTVREGEQVLGRAADADLRLSETFVSTQHARLTWQKGQLKVLDLNSTNGTLVNGVPVVGWTTLTDGDVIQFGGVEAVVRLPTVIDLAGAAGSAPPPQHEVRPVVENAPAPLSPPAAPTTPAASSAPAPSSPSSPAASSPSSSQAPPQPPPEDAPDVPATPPTGITITDIEAVTEGFGEFDHGMFGSGFGGGLENGRRDGERDRGWQQDDRWPPPADHDHRTAGGYAEPTPEFDREGMSPLLIIIAVAILVVILLAAVFLS